MTLERLDPTISRPSWNTADAVQPSQSFTSSSRPVTLSQFLSSTSEAPHGFFNMGCLDSIIQRCLAFIKRLFSCFFSSEEAAVQEPPLSVAIKERRFEILRNHLEDQLQVLEVPEFPSKTDSLMSGIFSNLVDDGKVAVLLKYDRLLDFRAKHLHGSGSLEELKIETIQLIDNYVYNPRTMGAHSAVFSITIIAMNNLQTVPEERATWQIKACHFSFYPNDRGNPLINPDFQRNLSCRTETFMRVMKVYTTSADVASARTEVIENNLKDFFFNP